MNTSMPVRYGIWLACFVVVVMVWAQVRIEVHQLRKDLDRTGAAIREARVLQQRLALERDARRRLVEARRAAADLELTDDIEIIDLGGSR